MLIVLSIILVGIAAVAALALAALFLRHVVPTNEVHIVQTGGETTAYGKETKNGNAYYAWPAWVPVIGLSYTSFPVSIFSVELDDYAAYDKERVPFVIDLKAFFRISDYNLAAERISSFQELHEQLRAIVQSAVRTIMASSEIGHIMEGRGEYGDKFTEQVEFNLKHWGVITVKNIELMDIRDAQGSTVIKNIMEKKKSFIEMESRVEVAKNHQNAQIAEIVATQEADLQKQIALEVIGKRTADQEREVGLAKEVARQQVTEQQKLTKEREMEVLRVAQETQARIAKQVGITKAEEEKQTAILNAEAALEAKQREAQGITAEGTAKAEAKKAMELAPVQAQIVLAKEIGGNVGYQQYLVTIRQVEANEKIGVEQAQALKAAQVKVIANAGSPTAGLGSVRDLFSSAGGLALGAMVEGLAQTPHGEKLLEKFGNGKD